MSNINQESSSFRDRSGFLFFHNNELYRQINYSYKENFDMLMDSGLYKNLIEKNFLIEHTEILNFEFNTETYKIIKPKLIPFISYSYEWSFSQLKDAALLTLEIQKIAMTYGMTLKDASSYNIQFFNGKPIFIDTLSFEKYVDGQIWKAYRQFCQHFLAPLALISKKDFRLSSMLKNFIDGIPIDLAAEILPKTTFGNFGLTAHIHAHSKSQRHYEDKDIKIKEKKLNRRSFEGIIENLHSTIKNLNWKMEKSEWGDYYNDTNYSDVSFENKSQLIESAIKMLKPTQVWDLGSNVGLFSRLVSKQGIPTISFDIDPVAVEKNYLKIKNDNEERILPLILDLTNPTPSIGWNNSERLSIIERGPTHTILALALIHHLAISNNLPLMKIANFFSELCTFLIIEFVPKNDSQVKRLLLTRDDIFEDYTVSNFEKSFSVFFKLIKKEKIENSERILYIFEKFA